MMEAGEEGEPSCRKAWKRELRAKEAIPIVLSGGRQKFDLWSASQATYRFDVAGMGRRRVEAGIVLSFIVMIFSRLSSLDLPCRQHILVNIIILNITYSRSSLLNLSLTYSVFQPTSFSQHHSAILRGSTQQARSPGPPRDVHLRQLGVLFLQ